ncbi:N-6 DNA methylase [Candidatus Izemoplasma sp. B36]|uniref:N-6 DNA methylase n=1 Tax=Candidatus Izemoplasma sp. B36 TaxID=3242468 RepID=UPI0035561F97
MNDIVRKKSKYERKQKGQFYTDNKLIKLIKNVLNISEYMNVLEPSAGEGAFIDGFLNLDSGCLVDVIDVDQDTINYLKNKYSSNQFNIIKSDFLKYNKKYEKKYDLIIGNPPFNLKIQNTFDISLNDSTDMFIYHSLNMLNCNGSLIMLVPGTFFRNKSYQSIRENIINNYKIMNIFDLRNGDFMGASIEVYAIHIVNRITTKQNYNVIYSESQIENIDYKENNKYFINLFDSSLIDKVTSCMTDSIGNQFKISRGRDKTNGSLKGRNISIYRNGWSGIADGNYESNTIICLQNIAYRFVAASSTKREKISISDTITILHKDSLSRKEQLIYTTFLNTSIAYSILHTYVFNYSRLTTHVDRYYIEDIPLPDLSIIDENDSIELMEIIEIKDDCKRLDLLNDFYYRKLNIDREVIERIEENWKCPNIRRSI